MKVLKGGEDGLDPALARLSYREVRVVCEEEEH
jgi:hypothetical protein